MSFGRGKVDTGVSVRVFSNDEEDKFAAALGLDYMLQSKRLRPTVGAAYLGDNAYIGLDLGLDLDGGGLDFGIGIGEVGTEDGPDLEFVDPTLPGDVGPVEEF